MDALPASPTLPDVAVIVPAAGQGRRMGGGVPKQYRRLGGEPVLVWSVRAMAAHPAVGTVIIAVPPGDEAEVTAMLAGLPVVILTGGPTRRASVERALAALPAWAAVVLVHDAVRPLVSVALVGAVIEATRAHGAAVPGLPVADTVRRAENGVFGEAVPRDGLCLVGTPQGFRREWLEAAYRTVPDDATDDAALVAALGHAAVVVPGERTAFKLTVPDDWALAERLVHAATDGAERA